MDDAHGDAPGLLSHQEAHHEHADEPMLGPRGRGRAEIISGGNSRRRWAPQEKARITRESFGAGARVADVARRNGVSEGLLHQWRKRAREAGAGSPTFVPVQVDDTKVEIAAARGVIEIDVAGATIRVLGKVDGDQLRAVMAVIRPRG